ncbi:MAG TPA: zinc ribbon domain-containing protein [Smithellaceae bacterium]|mgnify:FL=1|nr:zinc ribbon domain-containing protein [Smithellaceae bacterium]HRS88111.1 zinc ribbon domain-containing protein [Smithellaceae bacterium]HRV25415.1 zinc ribbon domain-containing protein [Smithellaceae bacterium]
MPIYEYKCQKCGKQFEALQGINDPDLKSCKFCRGKVHKMMSMTSFALKGSGWYATDYAGKKPQAAKSKEKESASTESSSAAETKTATAKED